MNEQTLQAAILDCASRVDPNAERKVRDVMTNPHRSKLRQRILDEVACGLIDAGALRLQLADATMPLNHGGHVAQAVNWDAIFRFIETVLPIIIDLLNRIGGDGNDFQV